ncbi:conserved hypothetical protein [Neospora caninum Liverpool]|uniref:BSD domain-containing protein n=1 Tax=Neospora caninum (strain Liverpool) TaxID=572307 RepID=F0VB70_NEOCL|nr:conserved hypothetical protein [Neospora caninum Liverpool]CBZ51407.1 conserved hypothetical protein [Neospora caninum Liverpool]CEL68727.1 TPA: hypothetical protein BN1204_044680 [Neospora caninum Liverpool]|eukprot:XP_003881440.1 conserved hypothetical protein [Neospora caninum Liverpool]
MEGLSRCQSFGRSSQIGPGKKSSSRPDNVNPLHAHISPCPVRRLSVNHEREVVASSQSSRTSVGGISPRGSYHVMPNRIGGYHDLERALGREATKEDGIQKKSLSSSGCARIVADGPEPFSFSRHGHNATPSDVTAVACADEETDGRVSVGDTEGDTIGKAGPTDGDVTSGSDEEHGMPMPMWAPEVSSEDTEETPPSNDGLEERRESASSPDGDGYVRRARQRSVEHGDIAPLFHTPSRLTPACRLTSLSSGNSARAQLMAQKVQSRPETRPSKEIGERDRRKEHSRSSQGDRKGIFGGVLRSLSRGYTGAVHIFDELTAGFKADMETDEPRSTDVLNEEPVSPGTAVGDSKIMTRDGTGRERPRPRARRRWSQERRFSSPEKEDDEHSNFSNALPRTLRSLLSFTSSSWNTLSPGDGETIEAARVSASGSGSSLSSSAKGPPNLLGGHLRPRQRTAGRSFFGSVAAAATNAFAEAGAVAAAAAEAVAAVAQGSTESSDSTSESERPGRGGLRGCRGKAGRGSNAITRSGSKLSAGRVSVSREPNSESDQGDVTLSGETSGTESEVDQLILNENATPFDFVLWATREAAASLQRPLLSAPPEEAENAEEPQRAANTVQRRELLRMCRLRAVALRLLLLICVDGHWCLDRRQRSLHDGVDDGPRRRFPPVISGDRGRRADGVAALLPGKALQGSEEVDRLWNQWISGTPELALKEREEEDEMGKQNDASPGSRVARTGYMWKAARRMLHVDRRLRKLHSDAVPRRMGETEFWKLYFYQVSLLMNRFDRQAHKVLRSLASSMILTKGGEGGDENPPQERVRDLLRHISGSTESDTSSPRSSYSVTTSPGFSARLFIPPTGAPENTPDREPEDLDVVFPTSELQNPTAPGDSPQEGLGTLAYAMFSSSRSPSLSSSSSGTTSVSARGTGSSFSVEVTESPLVFPRDSQRSGVGSEAYSAGFDSPVMPDKILHEHAVRAPPRGMASARADPFSSVSSNHRHLEPASRKGSFSGMPDAGRRLTGVFPTKRVSASQATNGRVSPQRETAWAGRHQDEVGENRMEGRNRRPAQNPVCGLESPSRSSVQVKANPMKELDGTCGETYQPSLACKREEVPGARA